MLGGAWYDNATKAIPLLEAAIARDPKFALAYSMIGHCHLVLHDPVKAKEAIDAALRISPNSAEAHLYLASYYIGTMEDYSAGEKVSRAGERVLAIADFSSDFYVSPPAACQEKIVSA